MYNSQALVPSFLLGSPNIDTPLSETTLHRSRGFIREGSGGLHGILIANESAAGEQIKTPDEGSNAGITCGAAISCL